MHCVHQRGDVFRRGVLADAVAQVENVRGPDARALVRRTKAV